MKLFADRLRHARHLRGLSQSELARSCGLSQGAISNYESASRKTAKDVFRLAEALKVNAAWLGTGRGSMEPLPAAPDTGFSYRLSDPGLPPASQGLWPFPSISSADFWALSPKERLVIEETVLSLLQSFGKKATKP
ncbi:helix-turn-helix domain-containing protein [Allopusillimonas ginsengisoli]|uniref:helix-turn-helix domain-containing protein n=1 Tax=Allopusillimonas ginsengisoli TaxID=453575 RepID=UPI001020E13B|nr:helix-turn-helix transcriptional regulator [Allopusillimonas ginsengisoli]TEA79124.1 XRE family transcriptional regulator [Allopusillimonas ginsengisoli]